MKYCINTSKNGDKTTYQIIPLEKMGESNPLAFASEVFTSQEDLVRFVNRQKQLGYQFQFQWMQVKK